jgi:alkanesulfonate monooxygenase SsuD/methylene tetrahydromethanopterin reductase-like flavin-dependent oxidoreductase (luciferase family)
VKFATLSIMDHHPSAGRSVPAFYTEVLQQIEAAEAFGFHSVWFAEHHQQYVDTRAVGNTKSFAELQEKGLIIVGGPDRCIRLLRRLEQWGVQRILAILNYGGMPHPLVLRSMERLAKEVVPAFHA